MYFLQSEYYRFVNVSVFDLILVPFIFGVVVLWAYLYKKKREEKDPLYRYLPWALAAKMLAIIFFCLAYLVYYEGDTLDYFNSTVALNNVMFDNFGNYIRVMTEGNKPEFYSFFSAETGYVEGHIFRDPQTFFVVRLFSIIVLFGGKSFLISSILMALISFIGVWKFYRLLCSLYPKMQKYFLVSALLVPSVVFWGSGLLKDSITLMATVWITYSIFKVFFNRQKIFINVVVIIIMMYLIISIKPYIFVSLAPGLLIWLFFNQVKRIKNKLIRALTMPLTLILVLLAAAGLLSYMGKYLGTYGDVDSVVTKVKVTQEDLLRSESYGSNSYNLGTIDPTPMGLLAKSPAAILAGLFRPFVWEARNPFVMLSALENLSLLFLLLFIIFKVGPKSFLSAIIKDPFLTYSMTFVILFAFGVGLASTNFGALVRYRIPLLPFFVSGLFILLDYYRAIKAKKELENSKPLY